MPGAGKTTLGRALALHYGLPFLDLDAEIVTRAGQVINNTIFQPFLIFSLVGAFYFVLCYPLSRWSEAMERKLNVAHR